MRISFAVPGLVTLLAVSSIACAPPPPRHARTRTTSATLAAPAAKPVAPPATADIESMLKREATVPLQDFRVRAGDGALELHVKAVAPPTVKTKKLETGGSYTIATFSIGSDAEVVCNASSAPLDIAHWAGDIVVALKLKLQAAPAVRVEAPDGRPLMFVDTDGVFEDPADGKPKRNIAKFGGVHLDGGSVTCVHDGIGYRSTFRDLMLHVATRTQSPNAERPIFRAVTTVHDSEGVVGFEYQQRWNGEKKGTFREASYGSVMLRSEGRWAAGDSGWFGVIDAKGVVSERSIRRLGSATVVDMKLERKSPGSFTYEGTVDGKPSKGAFTVKGPLSTTMSRSTLLASLLRDTKKTEAVYFHFDQDQPDKKAIRGVAKRVSPTALRFEEDGKTYECAADARGLCSREQRVGTDWFVQMISAEGTLSTP